MTLLLWIVRLLILLIIIRFVVSLFRGMTSAPAGGPGRGRKGPPERIGGTLVRDPQCGTYLPKDRAVTVVRDGAPAYFCSTRCRDEWSERR